MIIIITKYLMVIKAFDYNGTTHGALLIKIQMIQRDL